MDKVFAMKKKDLYEKSSNINETITVKIDVNANHVLDKYVVDYIETQLNTQVRLFIRDYVLKTSK